MAEVEPTRYKGVPLRAENQVDFYRDFAPAVREYGLENAVKAVIDISEERCWCCSTTQTRGGRFDTSLRPSDRWFGNKFGYC